MYKPALSSSIVWALTLPGRLRAVPPPPPTPTGSLHARRGSRPDLAVARDLLAEALRYEPAEAAGW